MMSTNAKSKNSQSTQKMSQKTAAVNSQYKVVRDLRQQFDDYVLKQEDEQYNDYDTENENRKLYQYQQQADVEENEKDEPYFANSIGISSIKKNNQKWRESSHKNRSKSKEKVRISNLVANKNYGNSKKHETVSIPKSYLMAMQHLQDLIENKNAQIEQLKCQLLEKQEIILDCQSRINEILMKYHELMNMYSTKENETNFLKNQIQELRIDKQTAIKQAAKYAEPEFKYSNDLRQNNQYRVFVEDPALSTLKQRSMSNSFAPPYLRQPLVTVSQSKQIDKLSNTDNFHLEKSRQTEKQVPFVSENGRSKMFVELQTQSARPPAPLSQKSKDRDYISYQRELLRNEKELIALKYRMQCLERKLMTDPKQEVVKQKIRKLSSQIELKQKIINDLKKF